MRPHSGHSYFVGMDIAGLGGNVSYIRPVSELKRFIPMKGMHPAKDGMQTLGIRLQGSFIMGFGGNTAPPFERFFQGGDTDLRGFDVRAASPIALISDKTIVTLTNSDGSLVPADPNNLRAGYWGVPVPISRLIYPGGDTSIVSNIEYRIPIVGPVTLAIFDDAGMNMATLRSQLRLSDQLTSQLNTQPFGCPNPPKVTDVDGVYSETCVGGTQFLKFSQQITPLAHTNYVVRMSTGVELQVILPVVNAPFRLYYAYNPLRVDTLAPSQNRITRDMFPSGGAGDYTFASTVATYNPPYRIREPRKTLRFTIATTF
jgi:outer membrane protein insertion porin family